MTATTHNQPVGEGIGDEPPSHRRARRRVPRIALSLLVLAAFGVVAGVATFGAYSDTATSSGNGFQAGTVDLDDDDNGVAMLTITNAAPGVTGVDTACITVTSRGSLDSAVRLYGTTTGTGLDQYVNLTVTRGSFAAAPGFDSCTGFSPDGTDYIGQGSGVVYNGTLQGFPDDWSAGIVDPVASSPEAWSAGETHVYKFVATIQDANGAQDLDASQVMIWEARNT
jgi:predicted ribosomally synthesized peptide with SipW-like signal peptide